MAVYKRTYKGYSGRLTPRWTRFRVLTRTSYGRLFQSKFLVIFLAACLFFPLVCIAYVYVIHNLVFLMLFKIPPGSLPGVDGRFFYQFCAFQGMLAYLLVALVSPSLIAWDLSNGALPLYFCRPFTRAEYLAGKMGVLLSLLSLITWVPALLIFGIETSLSGWVWMRANLWLAGAVVLGMTVWIVFLSLLGLALSALIRWKIAASAAILGVFFAGAGFGAAINALMRTTNGALIDLAQVMHTIWSDLFHHDSGGDMSLMNAWSVLGVASALCLWLLARRLKAFEVVK